MKLRTAAQAKRADVARYQPVKDGEPNVVQYSPAARQKLMETFEGLFTPVMRVVIHVDGGRDAEVQVAGNVTGGAWQSPDLWLQSEPGEKNAKVTGLSIVNDRSETVGQVRIEPPARAGSDGRIVFDPLQMMLGFVGEPPSD